MICLNQLMENCHFWLCTSFFYQHISGPRNICVFLGLMLNIYFSLVLVIVWIIQETAKLFKQIIFEN